jgi:uncharacterized protein (UPF0261 family)
MSKRILILGTLDTKGEAIASLKRQIELRGCQTTVMDIGILGQPATQADITREEVVKTAGWYLKEIIALPTRKRAVDVMIEAAIEKARRLYSSDPFDGIIGLGGGTGMHISTAVMRALPIGLPKLMVSSMGSMDLSEFIGAKDITMINSIADLGSLNRVTKRILDQAAGAICGMVDSHVPVNSSMPSVAVSAFGITTQCAEHAGHFLDERGYEMVIFHTVGSGGMAMEELIGQGLFAGVLDLTTHEFIDQVAGGHYGNIGYERLETAGEKGIPQIVGPGGLDCIGIVPSDSIPCEFQGRKTYYHDFRACVRSNAEELTLVARILADKLNKAIGPVKFLVPRKGWSSASREGEALFDPQADRVFVATLGSYLKPEIEVRELDLHIDDRQFAETAVSLLDEMIQNGA